MRQVYRQREGSGTSYFSSTGGFRRLRVLFQVSIFMIILVILVYILGFRSYIHNNYLYLFFKYLLNVVGPLIIRKVTRFRKAISPTERLCLTLHYLAYGGSQKSLFRFESLNQQSAI